MTSSLRAPGRATSRTFSAVVVAASALIAAASFAPSEAHAAPRHVAVKVPAAVTLAQANVVVRVAPPTRRVVTVRPARPNARAVWTDGYWRWNGRKHVWVGGRWVSNPKGTWVAGRWEKRPGGYVWIDGRWRR